MESLAEDIVKLQKEKDFFLKEVENDLVRDNNLYKYTNRRNLKRMRKTSFYKRFIKYLKRSYYLDSEYKKLKSFVEILERNNGFFEQNNDKNLDEFMRGT
jgi:hypothetical protein